MNIRVETKPDHSRIVLGERFDFAAVDEFRKAYEGIGSGKFSFIDIDFKATRYMDSSALGMLINARGYFLNSDTKLKLSNCNEQIKKIFSISRFDKKFDIS